MKLKLNYKLLLLLCMAFIVGFMQPSMADAAEKKDKAARRAQLMMQKMKQDMETEKANMQTQFDKEKKALEDSLKAKNEELLEVGNKLSSAEKKNKNLGIEIKKLNDQKILVEAKLQQTQSELENTQKNLADLTAQHKQALADLKFNDNQRKTLSSNLAQTSKLMLECEGKNIKLHQFGTDLIKLYDNPSSYESAMRNEKFFQLKRVQLENILQSKQDALDEAKFSSQTSSY